MKISLAALVFVCTMQTIAAQNLYRAVVQDTDTKTPLAGATVRYFQKNKSLGVVTNNEGRFSIPIDGLDSLKISMVGYHSRLLIAPFTLSPEVVSLSAEAKEMKTVFVRSLSSEEIVRNAIENLNFRLPKQDYGNLVFYREMIKDSEQYFSVSEALFDAQYYPKQKDFRLALEQGRAKEDVNYTRLFEDYHPGGGPQFMASQSFSMEIPECLQLSKMKNFTYKKDSVSYFDGRAVYVIDFDQKDGVKEAFEKGSVVIDAEYFTLLKYKAANSPKGTPYIKSLSGTDKIMAKLLGIDLKVLNWSRNMDFVMLDSVMYLQFCSFQRHMLYKQPKKGLDLDLSMSFEWMASEVGLPVTNKIKEEDVWKQSNLMVNLPTSFDSSFWGNKAILSPTDTLVSILHSIAKNNRAGLPVQSVEGWQSLNRKFFVAYRRKEHVVLTPTMKSLWENENSGPLLYKDTIGNINFSCRLHLEKASDTSQVPDRGFQQGGLLIRSPDASEENYVFLALGTGGNSKAKAFFKRTEKGKSKTVVNGIKEFSGQLLLEKKDDVVKAFMKQDGKDDWEEIGEYKAPWLMQKIQVGLAGFADFAGNGPKMHPDVNFVFSDINF